MGGVDKIDQLISYYRIFIRSRKWTLRMIMHSFDMAISNFWIQYKNDAENLKVPKNENNGFIIFSNGISWKLNSSRKTNPFQKKRTSIRKAVLNFSTTVEEKQCGFCTYPVLIISKMLLSVKMKSVLQEHIITVKSVTVIYA